MNTQTIGGADVAINGASNSAAPRPGSTDAFVDAALDALAPEQADNDNAGQKVSRNRKAQEAPEPGDDGQGDDASDPDELAAQPEQQNEEGEAEEVGADEEHDTRGSEDDPYTVKDLELLKDKYIELKVDGQKVKVAMPELAAGWIRGETFNRWANKTKLLAGEAEAMVTKARETQAQVRKELETFLHDPEELFSFFLKSEGREQVLDAVARRYAELRRMHRERPEERLRFQRQRDQERLAWERQQFEAQKNAELEATRRAEQTRKVREMFEPGWNAGLRKAGFPQPTQQLWDEVIVRCRQKEQRGEEVTSDDVAEFVARAAKLLELPPKGAKPRPAPAPVRPKPAAPKRGSDPWKDVPQNKKKKDLDFYLRGLKTRDFR